MFSHVSPPYQMSRKAFFLSDIPSSEISHITEPTSSISSPVSPAPPSAGIVPPEDAPSPSNSEASHQPPPAPAVPRFQTFGPDPSKFDDPTIYHIRDVTPGMTDEEKKEIYSVAVYPESDLRDRTCGTPPDKDFSNAKPSSQATFNQFMNFVEPYVRPLAEEDIAFLNERGDRVTPFVLPPRGPRHYRDIWTEEDVGMQLDLDEHKAQPYEPRGHPDQLALEDVTETENVSTGPVLARLLAVMRPERRADDAANGTDGDIDMEDSSMQLHAEANGTHNSQSLPPATQMTDAASKSAANSATNGILQIPQLDYASLDDRILQELRHIGFLSENELPDFPGHYDDEIAARLRFLQAQLRAVSIRNGARKARILELTRDRMAAQEYNSIADDLDNQLNQAYLKRNRTIGKGKKVVKKPGGAGGGSHVVSQPAGGSGVAKPGIGEPIRNLMDRRGKWMSLVGPVVNYGKGGIPERSCFERSIMERLEGKEEEGWNEVED
jgi:transcriptional adapter 3